MVALRQFIKEVNSTEIFEPQYVTFNHRQMVDLYNMIDYSFNSSEELEEYLSDTNVPVDAYYHAKTMKELLDDIAWEYTHVGWVMSKLNRTSGHHYKLYWMSEEEEFYMAFFYK